MPITNQHNLPYPIVKMLTRNDYVKEPDNVISVTTLLKSVRQIILERRMQSQPALETSYDVTSLAGTLLGNATHSYLEDTIKTTYDESYEYLRTLSSPATTDKPALFLEQRSYCEIGQWKVGGQFDMVYNKAVYDLKTTSVFRFCKPDTRSKYAKQLSMYRWLNPQIITKDIGYIVAILKDWSASQCYVQGYPQAQVTCTPIALENPETVDRFVKQKLRTIELHLDTPEEELPLCSPEDLWQDSPVWKYYKNPENTQRSTANFTNPQEAYARLAKEGKGVVNMVLGKPRACAYCPAAPICTQKDQYI